MRILLSNDDGVEAPGLRALVTALGAEHELTVVAPRDEQSAKSHALTLYEPLRVEPWTPREPAGAPARGFAVRGTPAVCVYLGVHTLLAARPDLVLSGINWGTNLGDDVHYSGTVAAAMEGALMGIPAIAISLGTGDRDPGDPHWDVAALLTRQVITSLAADPLPAHTFLNLNVPGRPLDQIQGLKVVPMGKRYYHPMAQLNRDPRGKAWYWIGGGHDRFEAWPSDQDPDAADGGRDGWWFERGYATLTPLHPDMTARAAMAQVSRWKIIP